MNRTCLDSKYGAMLHAYELGLLPEDERDLFESHLMDCDACYARVRELADHAPALRTNPKVRTIIDRLTAEDSDPVGLKKTTPKKIPTNLWRAFAAVAAVLVILLISPWKIQIGPGDEAVASVTTLAILDFETTFEDTSQTWIGVAVPSLLISDLSQSQYVRVVSSDNLRTTMARIAGANESSADSRYGLQVAREVGATHLLQGRVVQPEPLVVSVQLLATPGETQIASFVLQTEAGEDMFSLVDRISVEIRRGLSLPQAALSETDLPVSDNTTASPEAYHLYLDALQDIRKGYLPEAAESLLAAVELDSTFALAYYQLARIKDPKYIVEAVEYSESSDQPNHLYIMSLQARLSGDIYRSIELLQRIADQYPQERQALRDLAQWEFGRQRYAVAQELLEQILRIDPHDTGALNLMAYVHEATGRVEMALEVLAQYVAAAPEEPNPHDSRGDILAGSGRLDEAIEAYRQSVSLKPDFAGFASVFKLGRLHIFRGEYDLATELMAMVERDGGPREQSVARSYYGALEVYRGDAERALERLARGINDDIAAQGSEGELGDRELKYIIRALVYAELGEAENGYGDLDSALAIRQRALPGFGGLTVGLRSLVTAAVGDTARARAYMEERQRSLARGVPVPLSWMIVDAYIDLVGGRYDSAVAKIARTERAGETFEGRYILARALGALNRLPEAIAQFESLQRDYSNRWRIVYGIWAVDSYYHLAQLYESTDKGSLAIDQYRRFLGLRQNSAFSPDKVEYARERLHLLETGS